MNLQQIINSINMPDTVWRIEKKVVTKTDKIPVLREISSQVEDNKQVN